MWLIRVPCVWYAHGALCTVFPRGLPARLTGEYIATQSSMKFRIAYCSIAYSHRGVLKRRVYGINCAIKILGNGFI